jgi:glyoxylase-like metal-dependent hydrolase (beta-lactamase superfamily II)
MNTTNKSVSLRGAVLALFLVLCAGTMPVALAADNFSARLVAEHVWLVQGPSGNTLIAHDIDGLILIEGVPAQFAGEYLDFVRTITGEQRIKALVHTHWHPESAGLNASLAGKGTAVIAHANTRQWLGATIRQRGESILHTPVPKKELPDTIFHDKYSIPFRAGSIELGYLLWAHTDGDIYAWLPQQNILFTGPVLHQDGWSAVDESTNGFIGGLMDSYDLLATIINDDTKVLPASGELMSKADFDAQVAMYKALYTAMVEELRKSHSAEEVVIANPAAGLKPEWGDPSEFLDQGFRSFYGHLRYTRHVGVMP